MAGKVAWHIESTFKCKKMQQIMRDTLGPVRCSEVQQKLYNALHTHLTGGK